MSQGQRRLAAIMFTDMVGYTALGQRNESLSLALVEEQRNVIRPILIRHNGREVKTMGDAFLVEFPNAVDAVRCAYDIQRAVREFNLSLESDKRIHLRIGVHVGEVVESQGDISGDAVNVASRIEPLAEDGGICITSHVYDFVRGKVDLPLMSVGPKKLKNVNEPMEVYKMVMPWEKESEESIPTLDSKRIAVLPFVSMSPDPNDEYFADGLTEELITKISLVRGLEVIARTSAMNYKRKEKNASQIGKELKVGTLLEGSVRKAGNRIRISAQLINANTEGHLWAENYDRDLNDVFEIQSSVAEKVAGALKVRLLEAKGRIEKSATKNPEAYIEYLQGVYFSSKGGSEEIVRKAIQHFEKALELDPSYPEAMARLGGTYGYLGFMGYAPMGEMYAKGKSLAARAIALDENIPEAHRVMGVFSWREGEWGKAQAELRRSLELNPNDVTSHESYAIFFASLGRFDEAITEIEMSLQLDPLNVEISGVAGSMYALAGNFSEALEVGRKALEMDPNLDVAQNNLGMTYLYMGRVDDAVTELEKTMKMGGSFPRGNLGCAYAVAGRREEALRLVEEIKAEPNVGQRSYSLACVYAGLGEKEKALDYLEKAYEERAIYVWPLFNNDPFLANLREEPRFKALVMKMGLDKYQPTPP